jgi:hypothetical protein
MRRMRIRIRQVRSNDYRKDVYLSARPADLTTSALSESQQPTADIQNLHIISQ